MFKALASGLATEVGALKRTAEQYRRERDEAVLKLAEASTVLTTTQTTLEGRIAACFRLEAANSLLEAKNAELVAENNKILPENIRLKLKLGYDFAPGTAGMDNTQHHG